LQQSRRTLPKYKNCYKGVHFKQSIVWILIMGLMIVCCLTYSGKYSIPIQDENTLSRQYRRSIQKWGWNGRTKTTTFDYHWKSMESCILEENVNLIIFLVFYFLLILRLIDVAFVWNPHTGYLIGFQGSDPQSCSVSPLVAERRVPSCFGVVSLYYENPVCQPQWVAYVNCLPLPASLRPL
jgi:hypothetical protein